MKITKIKTGFQRKPRAFKAWEVSIGNYQMSRDLFFVNASSLGATRLLLGKGKKIRVADRNELEALEISAIKFQLEIDVREEAKVYSRKIGEVTEDVLKTEERCFVIAGKYLHLFNEKPKAFLRSGSDRYRNYPSLY